jgi:hypothetical protein
VLRLSRLRPDWLFFTLLHRRIYGNAFFYILVTLNKSIVTLFHCYGWRCVFIVALLRNCNNSALSIVTATLALLGQGDLTYVTIFSINHKKCVIFCSHGSECDNDSLLGFYGLWTCKYILAFSRNILPPSLHLQGGNTDGGDSMFR